ncbi:MAG: hypothetical protein WAL71_08455 [Terriglobales bacterium]|jgi:chaperonin GroEL
MAAKLATVDDCLMARMEDAHAIREGTTIPRISSHQSRVSGMHFDCGYLSPFFITNPERMEVAFDNVYILIHEGKIDSKKELLPLLEQITKAGRPLLIIAEDFGGEALATLVVNKLRGPLQVAAVKAPGFGEQSKRILQEIALVTGARTIGKEIDIQLRNIQISDLGRARKITVNKNHTVVEGPAKHRRLSFEPESLAPASVYASPAQSAQTQMQR